jgi:biopolymer transport protein ExbB
VGHHEQLHRHRQDPDHQPGRGCPGIAEALLATALGLVAAIPAVVIYNVFARSIAGYKAQVSDASAQVLLLVSRDLDHQGSERAAPHMVKVG